LKKKQKNKNSNDSQFSVFEWATIFYYVEEVKLISGRTKKDRMKQFMKKHKIETTYKFFKTKYYNANNRLNKKNNYPIYKLEVVIPFLKENYGQTVTKVQNDITFLKEESTDN